MSGGIYFKDAIIDDIHINTNLGIINDVIINVISTKLSPSESHGLVNPVLKLAIENDRTNVQSISIFTKGDIVTIRNNYQTITKVLTLEDSILLNE